MGKARRLFQMATEYGRTIGTTRVALCVVILALIPQLLMVGTPYTSNVAGAYLVDGLRLYNGEPPAETRHGPLFGILLFLIFKVFGISIVGAVVLVKVCFVLAILAFFLFLNELFGKWVAFFSSVLVMISKPIYTQLSLHIYLDALLIALEFAFLFSFAKAWKAPGRIWWILSGCVLGLAMLTKENALFLIPLPLAAAVCIRREGMREVTGKIALLYGMFFLTILPWIIFLTWRGYDVFTIWGWFGPADRGGSWRAFWEGKTLLEVVWLYNPLASLWVLFRDRIFPTELFGRFYVISLLCVFGKLLVRRKEEDVVFALAVVSSLPLAIATGAFGDRLGHMPEFLFLMHASLPIAVVGIHDLLVGGKEVSGRVAVLRENRASMMVTGVACGAGCLAVLLFPSRPDAAPVQGFGVSEKRLWFGEEVVENIKTYGRVLATLRPPLWGGDIRMVAGRHTIDLEAASQWLMDHVPTHGVIVSDGVYDDTIRFLTRMRWPVMSRLYPRFTPAGEFSQYDSRVSDVGAGHQLERNGKVVFMTNAPPKFRSKYLRHRQVYLVFEKDFVEWLDVVFHPDAYIVVHQDAKMSVPEIDTVFFNSPLFTRVHRVGSVHIFKAAVSAGRERHMKESLWSRYTINPRMAEDLKWLRENYHKEFALVMSILEKSKTYEMLAYVKGVSSLTGTRDSRFRVSPEHERQSLGGASSSSTR